MNRLQLIFLFLITSFCLLWSVSLIGKPGSDDSRTEAGPVELKRHSSQESSFRLREIERLLRQIEEDQEEPNRMPGADRRTVEEQLTIQLARELLALRRDLERFQGRNYAPHSVDTDASPKVRELSFNHRIDLKEYGIEPSRFSTLAEEYLRTVSVPMKVVNLDIQRIAEALNNSRNHTSSEPPAIILLNIDKDRHVSVSASPQEAGFLEIVDRICDAVGLKWWIDGDVFLAPNDKLEETLEERYGTG